MWGLWATQSLINKGERRGRSRPLHAGVCESLQLPLRWYAGCIIFDSVGGELVSSPHQTVKQEKLITWNKTERVTFCPWTARSTEFWHFLLITKSLTGYSSVGRAVDCSGLLISIGRWFNSGCPEICFCFLSSWAWDKIKILKKRKRWSVQKSAPWRGLEPRTYRLTAGRAASCAIKAGMS